MKIWKDTCNAQNLRPEGMVAQLPFNLKTYFLEHFNNWAYVWCIIFENSAQMIYFLLVQKGLRTQ